MSNIESEAKIVLVTLSYFDELINRKWLKGPKLLANKGICYADQYIAEGIKPDNDDMKVIMKGVIEHYGLFIREDEIPIITGLMSYIRDEE